VIKMSSSKLKLWGKKSIDGLKKHLIDTTGVVAAANPFMSILEVSPLNNMTVWESVNARITGTALFYAGLGSVFSKGRDLSKRIFKIKGKSEETLNWLHDAVYGIGFGFAVSHLIYPVASYMAGEQLNYPKIFNASAIAGISSIPIGMAAGYYIDAIRGLTGIEESERLPELVKRQSPFRKKTLATLLALSQAAPMALTYHLMN
jgi:hypothetical protein